MPRAVRKARPSSGEQLGLVLTRPEDRTTALSREQARLLKEIARRRKELLRVEDEVETTTAEVQAAIAPLIEQACGIERELHALFASLLAPGRLSKRKRAQVRNVYVSLRQAGLIGPSVEDGTDPGEPEDDVFAGGFADGHIPDDAGEPAGESASRPPDNGKHRVLRTLFKRLIVALHPDRAAHEDEKARRTAAMKDLTRAYELGDLARMIELEARLCGRQELGRDLDEPALVIEALERTVAELKAQLRTLLDELRSLRRSEAFRAVKDLERFRKIGGDPLAGLQAEEQGRLDDLLVARDFVAAFDAGKLTLAEFLEGPSFPSGCAESFADRILERVLDGIDFDPGPRRRRSGRPKSKDTIPF